MNEKFYALLEYLEMIKHSVCCFCLCVLQKEEISKRAVWRAETTSIGGKSHCKTAKYFIC